MHTPSPRADVCTTRKPRPPRAPKAPAMPYPDFPTNETGSAFWLIHVQRDAAKLAALRKHASSTFAKSTRGALSDALGASIRMLEVELNQSQKFLAEALQREQRGALE